MEIFLDCLPCTVRQTLEAARLSTEDTQLQATIMEESIALLAGYKSYRNSPELCRAMHAIIRKHTGIRDPYQRIKQEDIAAALKIYPMLKRYIGEVNNICRALKVSATGNVIDSAVSAHLNIEDCIEGELNKPFAVCDEAVFRQRLATARTLLFVGDNAGETVFDRVLLESLPPIAITYAARGGPAINDATVEDAIASGLPGCARIISTGYGMPGVNLDEAAEEFRRCFEQSDIVICKGQGNLETLSGSGRDVFFLLKCKCKALAEILNVGVGDYAFRYSR